MNNNPMGYNQGMDPNVFGTNVLRNDGALSVDANPTLNLLNQSTNQFGGTSTGNPTLDLLSQGNGGMPQVNNQFHSSGNPTLDLLNESNNAPENNYNFVSPVNEAPVEQGNTGAFSFLSENENQAMIRAQVNEAPVENPTMSQPVMPMASQPQPMQPMANPMMQQSVSQPMSYAQPVMETFPQQVNNIQPVMEQGVPQGQPNAYGFVPMMNQQVSQPTVNAPVSQPVMPMENQTVQSQQPVQPQPQVNNVIGTIDNLNFSFIPLREEAPVQPQPVQQPVMSGPTASQVFGQSQVMQPVMQQPVSQTMSQPMGQPMANPMMQQPTPQPMMGGFQPTTGAVQQSLDTLFPTGMPDGNGNFPQ